MFRYFVMSTRSSVWRAAVCLRSWRGDQLDYCAWCGDEQRGTDCGLLTHWSHLTQLQSETDHAGIHCNYGHQRMTGILLQLGYLYCITKRQIYRHQMRSWARQCTQTGFRPRTRTHWGGGFNAPQTLAGLTGHAKGRKVESTSKGIRGEREGGWEEMAVPVYQQWNPLKCALTDTKAAERFQCGWLEKM